MRFRRPFQRPSRRAWQALALALLVHALPALSFFWEGAEPSLPAPLAVELWPSSPEAGGGQAVLPPAAQRAGAARPDAHRPSVDAASSDSPPRAVARAAGRKAVSESRSAAERPPAELGVEARERTPAAAGAEEGEQGGEKTAAAASAVTKETASGAGGGERPAGQGPSLPGAGAAMPARFDAAYLNNPPPEYPPLARRRGLEGTVLLSVAVCAEGRATELEVRTTSGSAHLDRAALDAVRRWRFVPARAGGQAVASRIVVPIVFRLEG